MKAGLFILHSLLFTCASYATEIYLSPGDSQVFDVGDNIDTVFISSPKIANYEVIGTHSLIVFGQTDGRSELTVFNKNSQQILKVTLIVDPLLSSLEKQIRALIPEHQITLHKVVNTYVISGTVATEEERDNVYKIVGEGVSSSSSSSSDSSPIAWLDHVIYPNVINNLKLLSTNQVNVKLSVVEVTKTFSDNLGIDWGSITGNTGSITPGAFRFVKFNADTLSGMIHAIRNDSIARVLAEPNLSVLSGETAEFLVGGEVPVLTSSANGTSVQYKEFGIKLNVGAKVSSSERIRVTLSEEVSNVQSAFNIASGETFPTFQTRRAKTTVELADGESFLLGGLISNNEREELARLPFIGEIPILGALFRHAQTERSRTELVVVATVTLVKPLTADDVVFPDFRRSSTMSRFFHVNGIQNVRQRKLAGEFVEKGGFIK
ncbi:type II and III secretion system protein family protein [Erwinia sp.]|uniref:type II and III secretion system protein family protein n=1 Tax=Erwinia citreus TaxID=558 RepID=UPI003C788DB2